MVRKTLVLILTRHVGEALQIGEDIEITVVASKGNQVRIGIDAPKNVTVLRKEIYQKLQSRQSPHRKLR